MSLNHQTHLLFAECYQWHFISFCNHANFLTPVRLCIAAPVYEHYISDEHIEFFYYQTHWWICCYQILILTQTPKKLKSKSSKQFICVCFQLRHMIQKRSTILQGHTPLHLNTVMCRTEVFCTNIHPVHPEVNLNSVPKK